MPYFYYEQNGERYQIIADRYERSSENNNIAQLSWAMNIGPIQATYDRPIISIRSLGGTWKPYFDQPDRACPTSPSFSGNSIYHEFDDPYTDNSGVCDYEITLAGDTCKTLFYIGETVIRTLNSCPAISDDPRNPGCSECCRELLPMAKNIII